MGLIDLIGSAAGGSLFGTALNTVGRLIEPWNKKREAQVEIMLLEARSSAAEKKEAWTAFTASQANDDRVDVAELKIETLHPWVRNGVGALVAFVGAFRSFTRPGLTWALLAFLCFVWANSAGTARDELTGELTFGAFTALGWWFGARPVQKK